MLFKCNIASHHWLSVAIKALQWTSAPVDGRSENATLFAVIKL